MHEMGGNMGLFGDISVVANAPLSAQHQSSWIKGVGIDPEGINQNPAYYQVVLDNAWRSEPINASTWLANEWAVERCGAASTSAAAAWALLASTVYGSFKSQHYEHHMKYCPTTMLDGSGWDKPMVRPFFNASLLHEAWGLLIDAASDCADGSGSGQDVALPAPFVFDLVDVGREFLSLVPCVASYDALAAAKTEALVVSANASMTEVLADLDDLLGTSDGFLLGRWLSSARALVPTAPSSSPSLDADLLEMNARAQVTSWFPVGSNPSSELDGLWDYGNKAWSGLVRSYYSVRYQLYAETAIESLKTGQKFDVSRYYERVNSMSYAFQQPPYDRKEFPAVPNGDPVALSRALHKKYAPKL